MFKPTLQPISTRELTRMENRRHPRAVTGWTLTGSSYKRGMKYPGSVILTLEGGGYIWYPENTPLETAFADADDLGYQTAAARTKLAHWIKTGEGARFELR